MQALRKQPYPIITNSTAVAAYPSPGAPQDDTKVIVKLPPTKEMLETPNSAGLHATTASLLQLTGSPTSCSLFAPLTTSANLFGSPNMGFEYSGLTFPMDNLDMNATNFFRNPFSAQESPNSMSMSNSALPVGSEFYLPDFHEYSRQQYELSTNPALKKKHRMSTISDDLTMDDENDEHKAAEVRRQIHIQSEQKRRAQIKDGFEDLRKQLPNCVNKKVSKASILSKTVLYIQQLKNSHYALAQELERVQSENERLRQFQEQLIQKQALDKIYSIGL